MIQWTYKDGAESAPAAASPAPEVRRGPRRIERVAPLDMEDQRRLMLRHEAAPHNKKLASAAKGAGVRDAGDFREFQNEGYRGLYGGLSAGMLRGRKGLEPGDNLLDHMGSTELAANLFRMTQTEEKLRRGDAATRDEALFIHRLVGAKVRQTIRELGGVPPEELPPQESIEVVRRRLRQLQAQEKQAI